MSDSFCIVGNEEFFIQALHDRLLRAGASFVDEAESADFVIAVGEGFHGDMIILSGSQKSKDSDFVVRIHDLLSPEGKLRSWGDDVLHNWARLITQGSKTYSMTENEPKFWVHIRDVCDALCMLIMNNKVIESKNELNISGRRAWSSRSIIQEMEMLWGRYSNSLNHSHTAESLSSLHGPVVEMQSFQSERPDLSTLHDCLRQCGTEGWHPLVPMRVSLMEIFAHANA
tara:strand:- start:10644 stop:11327 length:684 start_codon:yes stop_codon:yes gene_type:complete